jgi:putative FmdB family regulatory protein
MPTYEYKCQECGHEFEKFQSMLEEPVKKCPVCKGRVKRLIGTGAGLIFKGSGFYITDYKKKEKAVQGPVKKKSPKPTTETKSSPDKKDSKSDKDKS